MEKVKISKEQKQMIEFIEGVTSKWRNAKKDEKVRKAKHHRVEDAIAMATNFSDGYKRDVSSLFSVILEKEIDYARSTRSNVDFPWVKGLMVVPLARYDGHDYQPGLPYLIDRKDNDHALRTSLDHGNRISPWGEKNPKDILRLATKEEITNWVLSTEIAMLYKQMEIEFI